MSRYSGRIKVVCEDRMCFPVHPITLDALACSRYDAYAILDPDTDPIETISHADWCVRRNRMCREERNNYYQAIAK